MKDGILERADLTKLFNDLAAARGAESALTTAVVYLSTAMLHLPKAKRAHLSDLLLQLHAKTGGAS